MVTIKPLLGIFSRFMTRPLTVIPKNTFIIPISTFSDKYLVFVILIPSPVPFRTKEQELSIIDQTLGQAIKTSNFFAVEYASQASSGNFPIYKFRKPVQ